MYRLSNKRFVLCSHFESFDNNVNHQDESKRLPCLKYISLQLAVTCLLEHFIANMSSAEHSKKLRTISEGKFTRMNNTILKNIDEDSSRTLIENRLKELRKTWEDVQRKHEEYILLDEVEMAQEENWIVDVSKTFDDTEAMVDAYLNKSLERDNTEAEAKRQLEIQETLEKGKQEKGKQEKGKQERVNKKRGNIRKG